MKKLNGVFFSLLLLILLPIIFSGCNPQPGLGEEIDIQGPALAVSSPDYMSNVSSSFFLEGTAIDNHAVTQLTVAIIGAGYNKVYLPPGSVASPGTIVLDHTQWSMGPTGLVVWKVPVDLSGFSSGEYVFVITATDSLGNVESVSKQERTYIYDSTPPSLTITSPVLYADRSTMSAWSLENNALLEKLHNQDIVLSGYHDEDTGMQSMVVEIKDEFGHVYYTGTVTDSLWNWNLTIDQNELLYEGNPPSGKTDFTIVTHSYDKAGNVGVVSHGWFCYWPESDRPWVQIAGSDGMDVYPGSLVSGTAFDDDGIQSLTAQIYKNATLVDTQLITCTPPYSSQKSWSVTVPAQSADYTVSVTAQDTTGLNSSAGTLQFHVKDTGSPQLIWTTPSLNDELFGDANGDLNFTGTVFDNTDVVKASLVWIQEDADKTLYLNSDHAGWNLGGSSSVTDASGNTVWELPLGGSSAHMDGGLQRSYSLSINLFTDGGISPANPLNKQDFLVRLEDADGVTSVYPCTAAGDYELPDFDISHVDVKDSFGTVTTYVVSTSLTLPGMINGETVRLRGTWTDNSISTWSDHTRFGAVSGAWNDVPLTITLNGDGTWSSDYVSPPLQSVAAVSVQGSDLGGNTGVDEESFFVDCNLPELIRISSSSADGYYKQGESLDIYIEFNKSVSYTGSGDPELELNNGITVQRTSGDGTSRHVFRYTVGAGDDVSDLAVTDLILSPGASFDDDINVSVDNLSLPLGIYSLEGSKDLIIDTVAPTLTSFSTTSPAASYASGNSLTLKAVWNEPVSLSGTGYSLELNTGTEALFTGQTDSSSLSFVYNIDPADNADPLEVTAWNYSGLDTVQDLAGNEAAASPVLPANSVLVGIVIDNSTPAAPVISGISAGTYYDTQTFNVTGIESGAVVEYTVNGSTWNSGTGATLSSAGTYTIMARQTDAAGNTSPTSSGITVTIDPGELLEYVSTASGTTDGTYIQGDNIDIEMVFRKPVTVSGTPELVLNALDENSIPARARYLTGSGTKILTFRYTVGVSDNTSRLNYSDTSSLDLSSATLADSLGTDISPWITLPGLNDPESLGSMANIIVSTGIPELVSALMNNDTDQLTLTFSKPVYKGAGQVTLTQDTADYRIPVVLNEQEYLEICSLLSGSDLTDFQDAYILTTNGGDSSGGEFVPNLEASYVLDFSRDDDDTSLVSSLINIDYHVVTVPIDSNRISCPDPLNSPQVYTVDLTGSYALPVKGADYSLSLSTGLFIDAQSQSYGGLSDGSRVFTCKGVEAPVIRVNRTSESLGMDGLDVVAVQPEFSGVKMSCQTPGANIAYDYTESITDTVTSKALGQTPQSVLTEPASALGTDYSGSFNLPIDGSVGREQGYRIWIKASATSGGEVSDATHEVANKTVLMFSYAEENNGPGGEWYRKNIKQEGSGTLIYDDYDDHPFSVWIRGGDDQTGSVVTPGFPISWDEKELDKVRLMTDNDDGSKRWTWITWETTVTAYVTFLCGTTPNTVADAQNGPWRFGWWKDGYVPFKDRYPVFPGESRVIDDGNRERFTDRSNGVGAIKVRYGYVLNDPADTKSDE